MRKSPLFPIFLIVLVDILGLTLILPLLPFYAEKFGASPMVIGFLPATYSLCQLVAGPILGHLSDRYGRRPLLIISQIGTLIGFLVLGQATTLWVVFLSRIIDGATAGNLSLAQAYISDVTSPENRSKSFAVIGIAFGIGFLLGPAISGFLSQYGYRYPIYAAAGLSALSILATSTLLPNSMRKLHVEAGGESEDAAALPGGKRLGVLQWNRYTRFFAIPELRGYLLQFFCFCLAFSVFIGGFALFAERKFTSGGVPYGPKQVGYLFAYAGFLGILLQGGLIGRLVKRFGERGLVKAGFFSNIVGYGILGFSNTLGQLLSSATVNSFGNGALRPVLTSLITQKTDRKEQGVVLGLTQSLNSIAQIIGPITAGFLIHHDFLAVWAWLAGGISLVGFGLARRTNYVVAG